MTSKKQKLANQKNSLLSTGAKTQAGKVQISKNAIKHGIFAKDLIIQEGDGKEDHTQYQQIFQNLVKDFCPQGQMQYLLIEKIATDYWRLKRILRFETGSIRKDLDMAIHNYYNKGSGFIPKTRETNKDIEERLKITRSDILWNKEFIKALKNKQVCFDNIKWSNESINVDIVEELEIVINSKKYEWFAREIDKNVLLQPLSFEKMQKNS